MIMALGDVRVAVGLRVGMAQDLAVAGFSLPQIMRAARWTDPKMPAIYIKNLKASESAVARLHELWAAGGDRVDGPLDCYDLLSSYHAVRFGT